MEEVETQLEASKETAEAASAPGKGEGRSEVPTGALLSQLRFLRNDLTRLSGQAEVLEGKGEADKAQTGNLLQRIASPTSSALPSLPPPSSATVVTPTNAVDLDDRLVKLERFVGASEADVDEVRSLVLYTSGPKRAQNAQSHPIAPSLITTLSKLEHQLQLLTQPRHLDTVARRVKTLVGDLERIHEARRKLGDTRPLNIALSSSGITVLAPGTGLPSSHSETTLAHNQDGGRGEMELPPDALQKIEALSNVLPRLEPLLPLAPSLLARLRTLAPLHASSAAFSRELSDVSREVAGLREAEGGLRKALKGLEMSFEANEKTVKGNLEVLEGRIESLTRKFP